MRDAAAWSGSEAFANAVDRSVCDRFHIVLPPQTADLTVHVTVANIVPTDEVAAAATTVLSRGRSP